MILTPYFLEKNQPVKMRFLEIPCDKEVWGGNPPGKTHTITLDMLEEEDQLHVLITKPDWEQQGIKNTIEIIASNLLAIFEIMLSWKRKNVSWYTLNPTSETIKLEQIFFKDDGRSLSMPRWETIDPQSSVFNLNGIFKTQG
jgi:hypothetical protein